MRPITALFADIVGSTGLGERLGADEVKALVGECVTRMSRAVEDFGGVIQAFAEELWKRARRLAERVGDEERTERVDRQLRWLRKRSSGELPLPPAPETG